MDFSFIVGKQTRYLDSAPWKSTTLFMQVCQASCTKSIKDIIKHMGVGPWVQPIKLSFPFTLKHHAVLLSVYVPSKKKGFLYRRVTSNQMLFWLSDIFLRIGAGQPPRVVKNLLPTSSCISVRLQIGDIYKLEILSFLSKALSMYVSGDFFFKPFHHKIIGKLMSRILKEHYSNQEIFNVYRKIEFSCCIYLIKFRFFEKAAKI